MRILESAHIPYETASYDDDGEHELGRGAAEALAKKIDIDPKFVFKSREIGRASCRERV